MLPQEPYKRFAVITMYIAVSLTALYLIFNYLWSAILPFLVAYLLAECFRPIVKYSEKNKKFPKRSFVLFVVLLAAASVAGLIYAVSRQVVLEISSLARNIAKTVEQIRTDDAFAADFIDKLCGYVPFVDLRARLWEMRANLDTELWALAVSFGDKMSGGIVAFVGGAAAFFPKALLFAAAVIIATYYFAIDRVRINCFFLSLFPERMRPLIKSTRDSLAETVGKFLRAYGLLFLITFGELLLAFVIIGIDYAFVLALLISLVDVLPVLGTGTVLIPWGIIALISGNIATGIGILVAYAAITVVRQVIEPKIVGRFIGLSPLAALASMYIGLKLMGIFGLFALPLGAILAKRVIEIRKEKRITV
ncbi:MAG: sporulation integral membrane protein YtvI [Clostridia bacterium]|nr:sporulation integral membrane protein YtvI [Clostridia bacterium]